MKNIIFFVSLLTTFLSFNQEIFYSQQSYIPSDEALTPTVPQHIQHWSSFLGRRDFYRRRIFFGKDNEGNPLYKPIATHAKENPEFGNVTLVIFHKRAWYKLRFSDTFEIVGKFSDEVARKKLINSMMPYPWENNDTSGGMWCPEHNAIIAGVGKKDTEICNRFAQYLKEQKGS